MIGLLVWPAGVSKNTKKDRTQKVSENALPTQTPFPSSHINQILHVGSYPGYLSWFQVSLRSMKNVGAVRGGEISAFPLTWHIAYTTACCYRTSREDDILSISWFCFPEIWSISATTNAGYCICLKCISFANVTRIQIFWRKPKY